MEWRKIPSCPAYEVSEFGDVRRLKMLKPRLKKDGYLHLTLRAADGRSMCRLCHTLVSEAFIGPAEGRLTLHGDGNRLNNHWHNLRYGTHADNMADRRRHGTTAMGERHWSSKLTLEQVLDIYNDVREPAVIAAEYSVHKTTVHRIRSGRAWSHVLTKRPAYQRRCRPRASAGGSGRECVL